MKGVKGLVAAVLALLLASSPQAWGDTGYRLVPLTDSSGATDIVVTDLNHRGEVVGARTVGGKMRAFRWKDGQFTDLHDAIDSSSSYTQAVGINDRSTIVGYHFTQAFEGFLLRANQITPLTVVPGESQVFPSDINNRGQIIADSLGGAQSGSFLIDGNTVQWLEGLPGGTGSMNALAINERGVIAGNAQSATGGRAVLWQEGSVMDLGVVPGATFSFAYALNNRNQVVGVVGLAGGSQAMRWQDGAMTLLPRLAQEQAGSSAEGVNDWGMIVGSTTLTQPESRQTATLWLGSYVAELDSLIGAGDPLKPYVHLESAGQINDRGDIVVSGFDSRSPSVRTTYLMTLFDN